MQFERAASDGNACISHPNRLRSVVAGPSFEEECIVDTSCTLRAMSSGASSGAAAPTTGMSRLALAASIGVLGAGVEYVRRRIRGEIRTTPPQADMRAHSVTFGHVEGMDHGEGKLMDPPVEKDDPYFWLRDDDRKNEDVLKHLRAENAYTNYMTLAQRRLKGRIYAELLEHYVQTDCSVPAGYGGYVYYERTEEGKSYKFYCRKAIVEGGFGEEEILLDVNELAKGVKHCDVGATEISPCGQIFAYSVDLSGYETYELRFLDLKTGLLLDGDTINGTTGSVEFGRDKGTVYYGTFDEAHRPWKIWRHVMRYGGEEQREDECLFTETDTEFNLGVSKSRSGRFMFLSSDASTISEHRFIDLDDVKSGVRLFREREDGVMYDVNHMKDDCFYIMTNSGGATNFKLMQTTMQKADDWQEFLPYDAGRKVDCVSSFKDFAVLVGREKGYKELWMIPEHDAEKMYLMDMEEDAHVVSPSINMEHDTKKFRFSYSSLTTPKRIYEYDVGTKARKCLKEQDVPNYNREHYRTERLEATSADGTKVPVSLVYNAKAISADSPNKLHLYGYGSYEISMDPYFSMIRLPLLDRGVIYAIAHIRGGGEYGREWYEKAKFETKIKTFHDFIACAQMLVDTGRTKPELMSMEGRSAGGLLMGAVMNMRPDLFKAVIAGVPFVDVLNTMSDASIPLTTGEWQEWGNPHIRKYFDAISEYCPYSNVAAKAYPATLILAGLFDPRVMYSEPAKWAVKLRQYSTSDEPILFKVDLSSGHFSASNRYAFLKEKSFELAWLLRQLGAADEPVAL